MRIAVTGAGGMLGKDLVSTLRESHDVLPLQHADCDITADQSVLHALGEWTPDIVINCAAYADVDGCELNPAKAFSVNAQGAANVRRAAEAVGARSVYISTDYVFDGRKRIPYIEDDPVGPVSIYGRSKLEGERLTLANNGASRGHLVVRTSWLYGVHRSNLVDKIVSETESASAIEVVADQISCPTWTLDLAHKLTELVQTPTSGIVHVANAGGCSRVEFAQAIVESLGRPVAVLPTNWAKLKRPARRPEYSVLDSARLPQIGISALPAWQAALENYLRLRRTAVVEAEESLRS